MGEMENLVARLENINIYSVNIAVLIIVRTKDQTCTGFDLQKQGRANHI